MCKEEKRERGKMGNTLKVGITQKVSSPFSDFPLFPLFTQY
jgi:hypothetical protein